MASVSSNWKALSKSLLKRPTDKSKAPQPQVATPAAVDSSLPSAKRAKIDCCIDSSHVNIPRAVPAQSSSDGTTHNESSKQSTDKDEMDPSITDVPDNKKRDMSILDAILGNSDFVQGPPSDDETQAHPEQSKHKTKRERSKEMAKAAKAAKLAANPAKPVAVFPPPPADPSIPYPVTSSDDKTGEYKIGKYVAIDCEMVGVGYNGAQSVLARVSMVNYHGHVVMDEYVLPEEPVTDYRTFVSGIRPDLLKRYGKPFKLIQQRVADIIKDRILIGHAIKNDLSALLLTFPANMIRDTSIYRPLRNPRTGKPQALRKLSAKLLGLTIQTGEHSSVEDARATMLIFRLFREQWEEQLRSGELRKKVKKQPKKATQ